MKKNILMVMMLMVSAMTFAQEIVTDGYAYDSTSKRWWIQAHVNGSYSMSEDMRYNHNGDAFTLGFDAAIGYNFNPYWGMFAQVAYNPNKGCTGGYDPALDRLYSFKSIEPSLNVTYNLSNGFLGYKHDRKHNLYLYLGPALAFTSGFEGEGVEGTTSVKTNNRTLFGGRVGLDYVYNFSRYVAFTADFGLNMFGDYFNGRKLQMALDGHMNLGVGLRVYLNGKGAIVPIQHEVSEIVRTEYITKVDTIYREIQTQDVFPVFFDADKAEIRQVEVANVKAIADAAKADPKKVVYVIGYADATSDKKSNRVTLAKNRADAIANELSGKYGIAAERIIVHDMGNKVKPFVNLTEKNRSTICIVTNLNR